MTENPPSRCSTWYSPTSSSNFTGTSGSEAASWSQEHLHGVEVTELGVGFRSIAYWYYESGVSRGARSFGKKNVLSRERFVRA
jgi:hypothetical protein